MSLPSTLDDIVDHWLALEKAAESGDEEANLFLKTYGQWAARQLDREIKN